MTDKADDFLNRMKKKGIDKEDEKEDDCQSLHLMEIVENSEQEEDTSQNTSQDQKQQTNQQGFTYENQIKSNDLINNALERLLLWEWNSENLEYEFIVSAINLIQYPENNSIDNHRDLKCENNHKGTEGS